MKIKMCGITTPADVAAVNEVRPDYIGMVMYFPKSKRNVSVETARRLPEERCEEGCSGGIPGCGADSGDR